MARLIDPDKAKEIAKANLSNPYAIMATNAVLDWTPRVDAVEVVRCKDCIHYAEKKPGYGFCGDLAVMRKDCDFCSYGERRTK